MIEEQKMVWSFFFFGVQWGYDYVCDFFFHLWTDSREFPQRFGVSLARCRNAFGEVVLPFLQKSDPLVRQHPADQFRAFARALSRLRKENFLAVSVSGIVYGSRVRFNGIFLFF